ncbi:MAG: glutaredoxin family protein [Gammaproteobacteria bacterium]|nr:glutaredoxin family protein [Gammaproteobacteria bacterium]
MSQPGTVAHRLVVYSRQGCELCEEMIAELDFAQDVRLREFSVVDIDSDSQLIEKYGLDIPVLTIDGQVICRHHLDAAKILAVLGKSG